MAANISIFLLILSWLLAVNSAFYVVWTFRGLAAGLQNAGTDAAGFGIGMAWTAIWSLVGMASAAIALVVHRPAWAWDVSAIAAHASLIVTIIIANSWNDRYASSLSFRRRGASFLSKKDYIAAICDLTEAIRRAPRGTFEPLLLRGNAWVCLKKYAEAVADFSEAIRISPDDPRAYYYLALVWAACPDARFRDGRRAVEAAIRASELIRAQTASKERYAPFFSALAAAYAESGDFEEAVAWQRKAIKISKTDANRIMYKDRLKTFEQKTPFRGHTFEID